MTQQNDRPFILVANDDGIEAAGLAALAGAVAHLGRVIVVAPDRERSGAGHALTLGRPLRVRKRGEDRFEFLSVSLPRAIDVTNEYRVMR